MQKSDLGIVVSLLADDELGRFCQDKGKVAHANYFRAFKHIDSDVNQYAAIFEINGETIGCLQITFIPGLSGCGSLRGQIEGVRVSRDFRGKGHGAEMIAWAIKNALIEMGEDQNNLDEILNDAEIREKDSNQILEFTKEVKNKSTDEKKIVIEALWNIIYSDEKADMYETNLMRRLSGLLYLDAKVVGNIKKKIKSNQ